jgi:beta-lactamase class A
LRFIVILLAFLAPACFSAPETFSQLEKKYQGRLGIFSLDTSNHHTIEYRAQERFPFVSTFKVILVGTILKKSESDPALLTQVAHYTQQDLDQSGYAPITSQHLKEGMTLEQLCSAAISYSDNAAANLLIYELGGVSKVTEFARSLGDQSFRLDRAEPGLNSNISGDERDTTTPKAMTEDLNKLVLGNALGAEQRTLLQRWLQQNTTGNERIRAGTPPSWIVGDKTGTGTRVMGDMAVLWPPHRLPIVLVIYFEKSKPDQPFNNKVIAEAARLVIQKFSSN